jgi:hypothetical protein
MMRVVVLGGAGNFGARIVCALKEEPGVEVLVAGRRAPVALDLTHPGFPAALRALSPQIVIHCVGPFQGQDYRVAQASLAAGANYIDLADGRAFVAGFETANDGHARTCGRTAITGASTLPALSSAVVDHLCGSLARPDSMEIAIAPGQRAPRGVATLRAVFSYLGRPVRIWNEGQWQTRTGWMDLRRVPLTFGNRWSALCDVPDLEMFPQRYSPVRTVQFHAALEFAIQHGVLWALAGLTRLGVPIPMGRCAKMLHRAAGWFDRFAGPWGGMRVSVVGRLADGAQVRRTWQLRAPASDGPEIPCMAAILLARRMLRGEAFAPGARVCMGLLSLEAFAPEFARWRMETSISEEPA